MGNSFGWYVDIVVKQCVKVIFGQIYSLWVCAKWVPLLWTLSETRMLCIKSTWSTQTFAVHKHLQVQCFFEQTFTVHKHLQVPRFWYCSTIAFFYSEISNFVTDTSTFRNIPYKLVKVKPVQITGCVLTIYCFWAKVYFSMTSAPFKIMLEASHITPKAVWVIWLTFEKVPVFRDMGQKQTSFP